MAVLSLKSIIMVAWSIRVKGSPALNTLMMPLPPVISAGETGEAGGEQGGEGESREATASANAGENAETSSNPFVENYRRQQNNANPYANAASNPGAGVLNLPEAYRAIDIVA